MKSATVILVALLLAAPMALGAQHRALKSGARKLSATKAPPPADYSSPPTMDYSPPGGYGGSGSGTGADYQGGSGGSVDYAPAGAPSAPCTEDPTSSDGCPSNEYCYYGTCNAIAPSSDYAMPPSYSTEYAMSPSPAAILPTVVNSTIGNIINETNLPPAQAPTIEAALAPIVAVANSTTTSAAVAIAPLAGFTAFIVALANFA